MKINSSLLSYISYGVYTQKETYVSIVYYIISTIMWGILALALVPLVGIGIAFAIILVGFILLFLAQYLVEQFAKFELLLQQFLLKSTQTYPKPKKEVQLLKRLFFSLQNYKNWIFHIQKIVLTHALVIVFLLLLFYTFQSFITPIYYALVDVDTAIYVGSILTFSEVLIDSWGDVFLQILSGYVTLTLALHVFVLFTKSQKWMRQKLL